MKILAIGNSFSEDATRYLHGTARAQGVDIEVVNLYIGGCALESHYKNLIGDKKDYVLCRNGADTGFYVSIREALSSGEWDVITLQQVSHLSFDIDSYYPYISELVRYIRECQPKAKLILHQTWGYENGSDRLLNMTKYATMAQMTIDIEKTYAAVAVAEGLDGIIPSGTMLYRLTQNGIDRVHFDTFHADRGIGRYALSLLWLRMLTGKSITDNSFCDFDVAVSDSEIEIAKKCVDEFIPFV